MLNAALMTVQALAATARCQLPAVATESATLSAARVPGVSLRISLVVPCLTTRTGIVIREEVEWQGTKFTTVLTAPSDSVSGQVTWTCRKSHVSTWYPAPSLVTVNAVTKRSLDEVSMAQPFEIPTMSPRPTPAPRFRLAPVDYRYPTLEQRAEQADQAELFSEVSEGLTMNGTMVVSKEAYLKYFKVSDAEIGTQYGQDVLAKFAMHDLDGDGFLTFAETEMLCDRDGC